MLTENIETYLSNSCGIACTLCNNLENDIISFVSDTNTDLSDIKNHEILYQDEICLVETENFVVIPDLSPITPGHVLIVSKEHYKGMTTFPNNNLFCEFNELVKFIDNKLEKYYGIIPSHFEHGSVGIVNQCGRCMDHFHYHTIVINNDFTERIKKMIGIEPVILTDYSDIKRFAAGADTVDANTDYLLYEGLDRKKYAFPIKGGVVPSQFLRKLVYSEMKKNNSYENKDFYYDWRVYRNKEMLSKFMSEMKSLFCK